MEIKELATNERIEQEGVWVDIGDETKLLIARLGNKAYERCLRKLGRPYLSQLRYATDNELIQKLAIKAMSRHVLLGWKNLQEGGKDIPYSHEKAEELLTKYHGLYRIVSEMAQEASLFREQDVEEAEGNSGTVSSGPLTGDSSSDS